MYNHNKAQQSKNRVHISWDILYWEESRWLQFHQYKEELGVTLYHLEQIMVKITITYKNSTRMACQCLVQYTHIMIKALLTFKILSTSISSEHYDTCISTFATRDQASHLPHTRDLLFVKFCKTNENNYFHWSAVLLDQIATVNNLKQIFYTNTLLCKFMQQLQLAVKISEDIWNLRRRIWSIRHCKIRVAMSGQSKFWRCQSGADCDWWKHCDAIH